MHVYLVLAVCYLRNVLFNVLRKIKGILVAFVFGIKLYFSIGDCGTVSENGKLSN